MDIKGVEWKVSDRSIERLGVDIIVIKADGTKEIRNVRYDGNAGLSGLWGCIETITGLNTVLGYEEKFWERLDHNDYQKRKKGRK